MHISISEDILNIIVHFFSDLTIRMIVRIKCKKERKS